MSDLKSEPISAETGTVGAGVAASDMSVPVTAEVESPRLAPEQEETSPKADTSKAEALKAEMPKVEPFKVDVPRVDAPKVEAIKVEVPKVDAVKPETPQMPGKMMIMSPGERVGADAKAEAASGEGSPGKRRMSAMAAVVALATVAGALGGALATTGFGHLMSGDSAAANASALEASIARIDADIVALKAGVEHTSKLATGQFNKTSDRLDKVEKAQAEPAAKLAKLSEAVDKLRAAPAPAPVAAAAPAAPARDVTGSVSQPAAVAAAAAAPPKPDFARLPRVEGWVLRDVANGGALIEGRQGVFEVYAGDPVPGLGRVDAIRKQDGKWVVVTSRGLISR
ncbi:MULTISPECIES: hypothetical protein [Bradyrhizobium]|uniref:Uncharacterized protein n=2 Tax=Bradyrhizobium TaxID=374 RepID=A0ABY0PZE5_9BRAD|nr:MULTISPECIES: hypothetical protein [Bradyrhizobium]SDJ20995.1 hypothetical protein SAMN05444163_4849 [Bradyrhizobium ottawaense]SEC81079.1 hypothetical protein SAMN05444171_2314 [Bradyrhizobium lablabi]SHK91857.1 hypothetical protein SAMN05444321_1139 [Bradyrhizobium lablabi]